MAFAITVSDRAVRQFELLTARVQRIIEEAIVRHLTQQPTTESKSVKRLRLNGCAEYELRIGDHRVLYNVEPDVVRVVALGEKRGNLLFVEGREFHEHESDDSE
jgi:mRNA-degrading endonuclease RelE of RelBE toxin-antitoxin system